MSNNTFLASSPLSHLLPYYNLPTPSNNNNKTHHFFQKHINLSPQTDNDITFQVQLNYIISFNTSHLTHKTNHLSILWLTCSPTRLRLFWYEKEINQQNNPYVHYWKTNSTTSPENMITLHSKKVSPNHKFTFTHTLLCVT